MEYLDTVEEELQRQNTLEQLQLKKQKLQQKLLKLSIPQDSMVEETNGGLLGSDFRQIHELLDCYRLFGVTIDKQEPNMVIRFDPLSRNNYHSGQTCFLELIYQDDKVEIGKATLPPFIPLEDLAVKTLKKGEFAEFIQQVSNYLYCYNVRREELLTATATFKDNLIGEVEVDLPVSHICFHANFNRNKPDIQATLTYDSLLETLPSRVILQQDEVTDPEMGTISEETIQSWRSKLSTVLLAEALQQIIKSGSR